VKQSSLFTGMLRRSPIRSACLDSACQEYAFANDLNQGPLGHSLKVRKRRSNAGVKAFMML
jgi:hypothetical protein